MTKLNKFLSIVMCLAMICSVFTMTGAASASAATTEKTSESALNSAGTSTDLAASSVNASGFSWDNATVYFLLTDRFYNGNTSNDHSYERGLEKNGSVTTKMKSNAASFQGGDFAGITKKINDGYFTDLGVNAIWLSAPYEQIQGYCCCGNGKSSFPHYAYHGYYAGDYTEFDDNFGTPEEFQTMIDTAHKNGIRIVLDIVMNHPGYNTMYDMNKFGFGVLKSGWDNEYYTFSGNNNTYHNYIQYTGGADGWLSWWGKDWLRAGLTGYDKFGGSDLTKSAGGDLPDFKTENTASVSIPKFLQTKWTQEGTLSQKTTAANNWFSANGKSKTTRNYLCYWLSQYVEKYGVDGFRCDTAKHVELESWKALSDTCSKALNTWRKNNPSKAGADWTDDFWMTGENYGQGVDYNNYYKNGGFESMINFSFTGGGGVPGSGSIKNTYADYANRINTNDKFNVLTYISSHDTKLCGRNEGGTSANQDTLIYQGSAFLLMPGGIQIFYGDECARPYVYNSNANIQSNIKSGNHDVRSFMNWDSQNKTVLAHWQKVGQFRNNHVAVGAGSHKNLTATSGQAFMRSYNKNGVKDNVMAVIAANKNQNVTITVDSTAFPNGTTIKNTYTGDKATVSGGKVSFNSGAQGTILMEAESAKTYNVTNSLGANVSTNNTSATATGSYKATLTAAEGYSLGTVKVTMGGTDVTSSAYSNGNINIANVTGDIVITATATAKTFNVTSRLTNATSSNTASKVQYGTSYNTTITPNSGYKLASVIATMGGSIVPSSTTGTISIPKVTGDIVIMATATKIPTSSSSSSQPTTSSSQPTTSSSQPTTSSSQPTTNSSQPTTSSSKPTTSSSQPTTQPTSSGSISTQPSVTVPVGTQLILGDANLRAGVTVADATLIQKYCAKAAAFSNQQMTVSDVNSRGGITVADATLVQKYCAKMAVDYPIGKPITQPQTSSSSGKTEPSSNNTESSSSSNSATTSPIPVTNYAVINNLLNATNSNTASTVAEGSNYTAIISPDSGYKISMVMASNGDETITPQKNSNGTYTIDCTVKGDIIITCIAEENTDPQPSSSSSESQSNTSESESIPTQTGDTKTITFVDGTAEKWVADGGAVIEIVDDSTGTKYPMTGGDGSWTVDIPTSATNITINRNSPETGETWNYWSTTVSGSTATLVGSEGNYSISWDGGNDDTKPTTPNPTGTVKFTDNQGWGTVYAYFYQDGYGTVGNAEWPGTQMTNIGDNGYGQQNFEISIPEGATHVVFSNGKDGGGSNQTADITLGSEEGYYTDASQKDSEGKLIGIPWSQTSGGGDDTNPDTPVPPSGTVKFTDNQNWGTVYAYFYQDGYGTVGNAEWPGTAMSNIGANDFGQQNFEISIPAGATHVVFNNGKDGGGSNQTTDITLGSEEGYYTDASQKDSEGKLIGIPWSQTSGGGDDTNPDTPVPPSGTVKFTDNQGWGTVYAYFFNDGGTVGGAEWPGTQMTNIGDNGFGQQNFEISIPDGATKVVFNNGTGGGTNQTVDVTLGSAGYYTDGNQTDGKLNALPWP